MSKKSVQLQGFINLHCTQSLPCVRGGGPPNGGSEGLRRASCEFALVFGENVTFYRTIPQSCCSHDSSLYTRLRPQARFGAQPPEAALSAEMSLGRSRAR